MPMSRGEKRLYRLYINGAVTLLILLIPSFVSRSAHYADRGAEGLERAGHTRALAASLHTEAERYEDRTWCEARAAGGENEPAVDVRDPEACRAHARNLRDLAAKSLAEAEQQAAAAHRFLERRNRLAALDFAPWWFLGAASPWILHAGIRWWLRRDARPASPPAPPSRSAA